MKDSNMIILPSGRQLQRYKNTVEQSPGLKTDMLRWMHQAAVKGNVTAAGRKGGIMHDEMKIQSDLVMRKAGTDIMLSGWVDTGEEAFNWSLLKSGEMSRKLASHVLQVTFLGYTGFRFPLVHFPTDCVTASELHIITWNVISELQTWGFTVDYIMQDGGEQNREFMNMHYSGNPVDHKFLCKNIVDPSRQIALVQDFSHNLKKLRNGVLNSGIGQKNTRYLLHKGKPIVWAQWIKAVQWDRDSNPRRVHYKLTDSHLYPNSAEKMRNHLAEEMMDEDMLHLMQLYQATLIDGSVLDGALALLKNSSILIRVFRDRRGISSVSDGRLHELRSVLKWFTEWENDVKSSGVASAQRGKSLPSQQCLDDIKSLLMTFEVIVGIHLSDCPSSSIVPAR
jgi:hypothetical protein